MTKYHMSVNRIIQKLESNSVPCPPSSCRLWLGYSGKNGSRYGLFWIKKKPVSVHRIAYEISKGEIPRGMMVCHSCDVTCCINPDHLFLGTQKDNKNDAALKNRNAKGERIASSVITEAIAREILIR